MRLNLGSGENYHEGWVNIDAVVRGKIDLIANIVALPFPERSIPAIYAGHLLEHMYPNEACNALWHWFDLLTSPGKLGIVVPDVQMVAGITLPPSIAQRGGWDPRMIQECVGGYRDPEDPYALHVSVYSKRQLEWFVRREMQRWASFRHGNARIHPLRLRDWPVDSFDSWQVGVEVHKS